MGTARNKHGPDVKIEKVPTETLFAPKITVCLVFLRLLLRLVNMSYQWFSVTLCYYGLSFASTNLSQHVWTDFLLRDPQTFITDLSLTLPSRILNHLLLTLLLPINLRKWIKSICSENSSAFLYCLLLTDDVWCAAQYRR